MSEVVILDSGGANIASLQFAFERLGARCTVSADPEIVRSAARLVLPGVGAAADAMTRLSRVGLAELLPTLTQPLLGICLGMQLLHAHSDEGDTACLGVIDAVVRRIPPSPSLPSPHMGWNRLQKLRDEPLLEGIDDGAYVYFVHGYAAPPHADSVALTHYGALHTAVVRHRNFCGTQFHPERSGAIGARILSNFLALEPSSCG